MGAGVVDCLPSDVFFRVALRVSHARDVLSLWALGDTLCLLVPELGLKLQREFSGVGVR